MEEPRDGESNRRRENDEHSSRVGAKFGNTHDLRRACHLAKYSRSWRSEVSLCREDVGQIPAPRR